MRALDETFGCALRGDPPNGILGSFWITPTGDTTLNAVAAYRIRSGKVTTLGTVVVPHALVAAA